LASSGGGAMEAHSRKKRTAFRSFLMSVSDLRFRPR
jgi:hypothetical protein